MRLPNPDRQALPLLTVLLLLTGEHLEEVGGVKNERDGTSEAWALQGFFCGPRKSRECVGGSLGGNAGRFQKYLPNSPRKSHLDLKFANTLSVFVDRRIGDCLIKS